MYVGIPMYASGGCNAGRQIVVGREKVAYIFAAELTVLKKVTLLEVDRPHVFAHTAGFATRPCTSDSHLLL